MRKNTEGVAQNDNVRQSLKLCPLAINRFKATSLSDSGATPRFLGTSDLFSTNI